MWMAPNNPVKTFATACLWALLSPALLAASKDGNLVIGYIGRSSANPIYRVALEGAEQAAKDLGAQYGIKIKIVDATPAAEDAHLQVAALEKLVLDGVDGVTISCSDTSQISPAIDDAVDAGVNIATFASDAPQSKRFFSYMADNDQCGHTLMVALAKAMKGKGVMAILGGTPTAQNLKLRVAGLKAAAALYPGITLRGVYYSKESGPASAARIAEVMKQNPDITGWAIVASWPLTVKNAFPWAPGTVKCVAVGMLPDQLEYIRNRYVTLAIAQPYWQWGYRTAERIILKAALNRKPPEPVEYAPVQTVTYKTAGTYGKLIENWLTRDDAIAPSILDK